MHPSLMPAKKAAVRLPCNDQVCEELHAQLHAPQSRQRLRPTLLPLTVASREVPQICE